MALNAVISTDELATLPADVKTHYVEKDGQVVLQVTPAGGLELSDSSGLKSALQGERVKTQEAEAKLADAHARFKDIDPVAARDALAKVSEMDGWDPERKLAEHKAQFEKQITERFEREKTQLIEKHDKELGDEQGARTTVTGQLQKELVTSAAVKAIAEADGSVELLLPIVSANARMKLLDNGEYVAEIVDENGLARLSTEAGSTSLMTIAERVAEIKDDKRYGGGFSASDASGGGATGGNDQRGGPTTPVSDLKIDPVEKLKLARRSQQ